MRARMEGETFSTQTVSMLTHTHTHIYHLLSDSICGRLLEVTAAIRATESEQE